MGNQDFLMGKEKETTPVERANRLRSLRAVFGNGAGYKQLTQCAVKLGLTPEECGAWVEAAATAGLMRLTGDKQAALWIKDDE